VSSRSHRLQDSTRCRRGRGGAGRLGLCPGDRRRGCHLPRAPAGRPRPSPACPWEPRRGATPFPLWPPRVGCQSTASAPLHPFLSPFTSSPPPTCPPHQEIIFQIPKWGVGRESPAVSRLLPVNCKVLPSRPGRGRLGARSLARAWGH
jgi:hypothetical protein